MRNLKNAEINTVSGGKNKFTKEHVAKPNCNPFINVEDKKGKKLGQIVIYNTDKNTTATAKAQYLNDMFNAIDANKYTFTPQKGCPQVSDEL